MMRVLEPALLISDRSTSPESSADRRLIPFFNGDVPDVGKPFDREVVDAAREHLQRNGDILTTMDQVQLSEAFARHERCEAFWVGMRAEYAFAIELWLNMRDDPLPDDRELRAFSLANRSVLTRGLWFLEAARSLSYYQKMGDAARDPAKNLHVREQVDEDRESMPFWFRMTRRSLPGGSASVWVSWVARTARLRCAIIAIAVERYRLAEGRWPTTLDELPVGPHDKIMLGPFDDVPIRFERTDTGCLISTAGYKSPTGDQTLSSYARPFTFTLLDPDRRFASYKE